MVRLLGGAAMVVVLLLEMMLTLGFGAGAARLGGLRAGAAGPRTPLRCSFAASTPVVLADGTTKPIAEVGVGDTVLAADPETGDRGPRGVTHVWKHEDVLVDLESSDGAVVSTTDDHPFWNATDRRWQPASALDRGDRLLTAAGAPLTVDGLDPATAARGVAYNLTVADLHTYYVGFGDHTALVHNTCPRAARAGTTKQLRALKGKAKAARWVKSSQRAEGPGLRDHFRKHGSDVGAKTAREYDLSARRTIQKGRRFHYRDPGTNAPRVGYWHDGLFTATSVTRGRPAILTHFPLSRARARKLPGFTWSKR